ncbi:MAG: peptidyl-prolyl cis-trans isomerase [Alicyclobacillus sp.]|nr:peptidyl-prolyl cis-trans isomerase [Alicyclobacillus sp.]
MPSKRAAALVAVLTLAWTAGCGGPSPANNTAGSAATATNNTANATSNAPLPPEAAFTGPVVATYTGGELRKDELDKQYNLQVVLPGLEQQESKKDFVSYYIVWYKYLYNQAQQLKDVQADPAGARQWAQQSLQQLVGTTYKTQADEQAKMQTLGLTEDDLARLAMKNAYIRQYLLDQMKTVQVTDQQAQDYYNQHKTDYLQVTVDQILVSSLDQAKQIEAQLKAGANFQKLADQYSIDPGVKENHGTYSDQLVSSFVPEFAQACKTLPIGQISDPVQTQYGYHILRVDKRTQLPFDQVKDDIKQQLLQQAQNNKEQEIYQNALKAANIQVKVKDDQL